MMLLKTLVVLTFIANAQAPVSVTTELVNDVAHIEFSGRENWQYDVQRLDDGRVALEIDRMDDRSIVALKTFQNSFISSVEITEGTNDKQKVIFTLKDPKTRNFEYITDQPSRLIVDFYKDNEKKAELPQKKKPDAKIAKSLPKKKDRVPAGTDFLIQSKNKDANQINVANLDGADAQYDRFRIKDYEIKESAIIASQLNLYIRFPMLTVPIDELKEIHENPAIYSFETREDEENKKARLLLTLFNKNRNTVFLKALDLYRAEFPNSKYNEALGFMEADTYYKIWQKDNNIADFEKAMLLYSKSILATKNSAYHDRTQRLIAYAYFDRKDYLSAFTNFQRYQNQNPESPYKYKVQIAMAESLANLNNMKDALEIYNKIENDSQAGVYAVEAAFRKADLYAQKQDYKNAIAEYERVQKKYSSYLENYPNAYYNKAESKFWLNKEAKNLSDSLNDYIVFIDKFPKNTHVSYAMERIGELLEMLGAPQARYEGAFLESIYRYPNSQAAGVAKIRLLKQRIPEMKEKDIEDEITKINQFIKSSDLEKLSEFKNIMISDGYYAKKEYDKSLDLLINFYQKYPLSNYLDIFKTRIVKTFRDQMYSALENNDYIKTFQIYGKNSAVWLNDEKRLDIPYILGLAFEKSGVPDEAIKKYQYVLDGLNKIKGTKAEKEKNVLENIPPVDELNLRLASSYAFKGEYGKALDYLKEINEQKLTNENSRVENTYLSSIVHEKLNNTKYAIEKLKSLTETWSGNPDKISGVLLRLANLQETNGSRKEALASLNKVLNIAKDTNLVEDRILIQTYELKAKIDLAAGNKDEAINSYKELLEKFEGNYPLYSARYNLGKIYFDKNEIKDAEKIWGSLQGKPEAQIWGKLAQENLKSSNFKDEYKKYVDRIPAMEKKGDKK